MDSRAKWIEVWQDMSPGTEYILVVRSRVDGLFDIFDPRENKTIETFGTYDEVTDWLVDDEYTLIEGRTSKEQPESSADVAAE